MDHGLNGGIVPLYKTEGIVLKQGDFLEADKLITLYSRNLGKIKVIAKGIKRPGSKLGGRLELFTYCRLLLAKGRNLDIVSDVEIKRSHLKLREDLAKLSYGLYIIELVEKGVEERSKSFNLFNLLALSLSSLEAVDYPSLEAVARIFEAGLISLLGYKPTLERCVECGRKREVGSEKWEVKESRSQGVKESRSQGVKESSVIGQQPAEVRGQKFSIEKGGVLCRRCGEKDRDSLDISAKTLEVMKFLFLTDNHCNLLKNHLPLTVDCGLWTEDRSQKSDARCQMPDARGQTVDRKHKNCGLWTMDYGLNSGLWTTLLDPNHTLKRVLRLYLSYHLNLNMKSQDLPLID